MTIRKVLEILENDALVKIEFGYDDVIRCSVLTALSYLNDEILDRGWRVFVVSFGDETSITVRHLQ